MLRTYNFLSVKPPKTDKKTEKFYRKSLKLSVSRIEYPTKHDKTLQEPTMKTDNVNTFTDKGIRWSTQENGLQRCIRLLLCEQLVRRFGGLVFSRLLKYKELAEQIIYDDDDYLRYSCYAEFVQQAWRADEGAKQPEEEIVIIQAFQMHEADEKVLVKLNEDERHQEIEDKHGAAAEGELDHLDQHGLEALVFAPEDPIFVDEEREYYRYNLRHARTENGVVREDMHCKPGNVIDDSCKHTGNYIDDYLAVFS